MHAEESALLEIGKGAAKGAHLYTTHHPCLLCARKIIHCGITEVYYCKPYKAEKAVQLLEQANVKVFQLDPNTGKSYEGMMEPGTLQVVRSTHN